jgi:hypothetical protein
MTILLTEIHNHANPARALILFAADRRISSGGQYTDTRKKLLEMPHLNAALGYFGLAQVGRTPMTDWLASHIRADHSDSLEAFAFRLTDQLNSQVPIAHRSKLVSGFHVAGFGEARRAEFWFIRNSIADPSVQTGMYEARQDFQARDAPNLAANAVQIYRNGDIRPHVLLWTDLDKALTPLLHRADFRRVTTVEHYKEWVRFKLEIIAYVYKKWCTASVIGRPIDVICLRRKEG